MDTTTPRGIELDLRGFRVRRCRRAAGNLDHVGDADTAQKAALLRLLLALLGAGPVGKFERVVHVAFEFAGIVDEHEFCVERHLLRRDHVLAP